MTTQSLYALSTKYNSYIGYYSGSVTDLIKYEWEGMDVNVQLFYTHSNAKELVAILKKYFKNKLSKSLHERDAYGFWVEKLTTEELDDMFKFMTPKLKHVEEDRLQPKLDEYVESLTNSRPRLTYGKPYTFFF